MKTFTKPFTGNLFILKEFILSKHKPSKGATISLLENKDTKDFCAMERTFALITSDHGPLAVSYDTDNWIREDLAICTILTQIIIYDDLMEYERARAVVTNYNQN